MNSLIEVELDKRSYHILSTYLIALMLIGSLLIAIPFILHQQGKDRYEFAYQKEAKVIQHKYGIDPQDLDQYRCYLGRLHYLNPGLFSGYIPVLPYKACEPETFLSDVEKLKATQPPLHWSVAITGIILNMLSSYALLALRRQINRAELKKLKNNHDDHFSSHSL